MGPRIWCHPEPHPFNDHIGGVERGPKRAVAHRPDFTNTSTNTIHVSASASSSSDSGACILGEVVSSDTLLRQASKSDGLHLQDVQSKHQAAHAMKADVNTPPPKCTSPRIDGCLGGRPTSCTRGRTHAGYGRTVRSSARVVASVPSRRLSSSTRFSSSLEWTSLSPATLPRLTEPFSSSTPALHRVTLIVNRLPPRSPSQSPQKAQVAL